MFGILEETFKAFSKETSICSFVNMELSRGRIIFMSITVSSAYVVWGLLISLQPPFYPQEAEKKGASPSQVKSLYDYPIFYSVF